MGKDGVLRAIDNNDETKASSAISQTSAAIPATSTSFEGLLTSVASMIPASLQQVMDEQRISRLSQCRQLEEVLAHCKQKKQDRAQLEDFPMGIRMVRYFDWRRPATVAQNENANDAASAAADIPPSSCVREEHAVWACRSVSLQCGPDLLALKNCFQQEGHDRILSQSETFYKSSANHQKLSSSPSSSQSCGKLQAQLGACVHQKALALGKRQKQWSKKPLA